MAFHEFIPSDLPSEAVVSRELADGLEAIEAKVESLPDVFRDLSRAMALPVLNASAIIRLEMQLIELRKQLGR